MDAVSTSVEARNRALVEAPPDLLRGGLQRLADRVAVLGGSFAVSSPLGAGTLVGAELPD